MNQSNVQTKEFPCPGSIQFCLECVSFFDVYRAMAQFESLLLLHINGSIEYHNTSVQNPKEIFLEYVQGKFHDLDYLACRTSRITYGSFDV